MADRSLPITDTLTIPDTELELRFSRSSGAGGQNVNKVNSRAELRYALEASTVLGPGVKSRLRRLAGRRMTADGWLLLTSQRYRDQSRNIDDCYEKLRAMVLEALTPEPERFETKVPRGAKERRLKEKRVSSGIKRGRGRVSGED